MLFACTHQTRQKPPPKLFHQIRLLDTKNADFDFYDLRGKVVLVDVFASHCMPCQFLVRRWDKLARKHKSQGLRVVGIALEKQVKQVLRPFLMALDIQYPVVVADDSLYKGNTILGPVLTVPRQYLVDGCGKIHKIFQGMVNPQKIEQAVLDLLKQPPQCQKTK
ncbi:MAG: TlpA family protein disulfide reductase [Myxococcales bacterium]|nr:TlpA family protein disulfide reductase [Myxococcales bacterium]